MSGISHLTPLCDLDYLAYAAGFAAQKDNAPVSHACQMVKTALGHIKDTFSDAPEHKFYITGEGNFRETCAKVLPIIGKPCKDGSPWQYKGNRKGSPKPAHFEDIRKYMVDQWGCVLVEGMEADDAVGMEQWARRKEKDTCIVSIDKDLRMIGGFLMIPRHQGRDAKVEYISRKDADLWFWVQMLMGDMSVDYIPGIDGIGIKIATKIVYEECGGDLTLARKRTEAEYQKQYGRKFWQGAFEDCANLLWIRREPDKKWSDYL